MAAPGEREGGPGSAHPDRTAGGAPVIVVLVLDGLLAGLAAGTRGWRLGVEAGCAAVFGGLIAALLFSLHQH